MSTVPEVIAAQHMHLPTLAVSVITDLCDPARLRPVELPEILTAAAEAEPRLTALIRELVTAK
jgi:purine-nucleoside phosphorylase